MGGRNAMSPVPTSPKTSRPMSPRTSRPMSPMCTPKKSHSYDGSGRMTPKRNLIPASPARDTLTAPRCMPKPKPPVITTPPRAGAVRAKPRVAATPPRARANYAKVGVLLNEENEENVKPKHTPRSKLGASMTRPASYKAAPAGARLVKASDSAKKPAELKKPLANPRLAPSAKQAAKPATNLAGRADMKKLTAQRTKTEVVKPEAVRRPVLGSLENKNSKISSATGLKKTTKPVSDVKQESVKPAGSSGIPAKPAAKSGVPTKSGIPGPRSKLPGPSRLPTRSRIPSKKWAGVAWSASGELQDFSLLGWTGIKHMTWNVF